MSDCEAIRFDILKYDVYAKSPGEETAFCRWTQVNRKIKSGNSEKFCDPCGKRHQEIKTDKTTYQQYQYERGIPRPRSRVN